MRPIRQSTHAARSTSGENRQRGEIKKNNFRVLKKVKTKTNSSTRTPTHDIHRVTRIGTVIFNQSPQGENM